MALSPSVITALIGGGAGVLGALIPVLSAHFNAKAKAKPEVQEALNASFQVIVDELRLEREQLGKTISKLEAYNTKLKGYIATLTEYADALRDFIKGLGAIPPPRPKLNGRSLSEGPED